MRAYAAIRRSCHYSTTAVNCHPTSAQHHRAETHAFRTDNTHAQYSALSHNPYYSVQNHPANGSALTAVQASHALHIPRHCYPRFSSQSKHAVRFVPLRLRTSCYTRKMPNGCTLTQITGIQNRSCVHRAQRPTSVQRGAEVAMAVVQIVVGCPSGTLACDRDRAVTVRSRARHTLRYAASGARRFGRAWRSGPGYPHLARGPRRRRQRHQ